MKKIKYIVLGGIVFGVLYGFTLVKTTNPEKDKLLLEIMAYVLERGHYDPETIDDSFSENVFMNYIESMDCLLYTSPSPRDLSTSRMPSSA